MLPDVFRLVHHCDVHIAGDHVLAVDVKLSNFEMTSDHWLQLVINRDANDISMFSKHRCFTFDVTIVVVMNGVASPSWLKINSSRLTFQNICCLTR